MPLRVTQGATFPIAHALKFTNLLLHELLAHGSQTHLLTALLCSFLVNSLQVYQISNQFVKIKLRTILAEHLQVTVERKADN